MLLFAFLYLISKAAELMLSRASPEYSKLSFEHKRNTVTCGDSALGVLNTSLLITQYSRFDQHYLHDDCTWLPTRRESIIRP
jgi:hypothetical protein